MSIPQNLQYTLAKDGDGPERRWFRPPLADLFPFYEVFWSRCIVPLTYRMIDRDVILVRFTLPEMLQYFASAHHGVFYRLGLAAQEYQDKETLVRPEGFLEFYLHLHTAIHGLLNNFLRSAGIVHGEFLGTKIGDLETWASKWKKPELVTERARLVEEMAVYRDYAAHFLPVILWKRFAPSSTFLGACKQQEPGPNASPTVNLAQMARMIMDTNPLDDKSPPVNYVDIDLLSEGHLRRCLVLCNEIWTCLYQDFSALVEIPAFKSAVRPLGLDEAFVARFKSVPSSMQGLQGHQGLFPERK